jgi:medium-chain acyl-[acyl-carrier-protein] hydrolase
MSRLYQRSVDRQATVELEEKDGRNGSEKLTGVLFSGLRIMSGTRNRWLSCQREHSQTILSLFCFPYAGGSASIFRRWSEGLPDAVDVCPIQLPGRGSRLPEPSITKMPTLIQAIAEAICPHLQRPFAFLGHSMGALIGFELARHLRAGYGVEPVHLFVSGCRAPQVSAEQLIIYDLPDSEFLKELSHLNGTPREVLEHPELMQLMLPTLRADLELVQTYTYAAGAPLQCPVTVFGGLQDKEIKRTQLRAWSAQTTARFSLRMLPGDHFFIHASRALFLKALSREVNQIVSRIG